MNWTDVYVSLCLYCVCLDPVCDRGGSEAGRRLISILKKKKKRLRGDVM